MYLIEEFLTKIYGERFSGEMASNSKGEGYDIEDFREYIPGDSVKRINWKLSAKYDTEYISLYKVEKEPVVDIFCDLNINFSLLEDKIYDYLGFLDNLFHKLGIRKNIYVFYKNGLFLQKIKYEKVNFFKEIKISKKSSCINEVFESDVFKASKHYKIIISDFFFLKKVPELEPKKNFFTSLDYNNLLKGKSFPVLNGYFSSGLTDDIIKDWNKIIGELSKYGVFEKII